MMNDKRWLVWGLAAVCGALVLWRLWPRSTHSAIPSKLRLPRRTTDLAPFVENTPPEPEAASPAEAIRETASPLEVSLEEPAAFSPETAPVHLNSSSPAELQTLPGIGPVLAERIVAARPFASVDDLKKVSGVGPIFINNVKPLVEL